MTNEQNEPTSPPQVFPPASAGEKAIVIAIFTAIVLAAFVLLGVFLKSVLVG